MAEPLAAGPEPLTHAASSASSARSVSSHDLQQSRAEQSRAELKGPSVSSRRRRTKKKTVANFDVNLIFNL